MKSKLSSKFKNLISKETNKIAPSANQLPSPAPGIGLGLIRLNTQFGKNVKVTIDSDHKSPNINMLKRGTLSDNKLPIMSHLFSQNSLKPHNQV